MADVTTLQPSYELGMRQDEARPFLPRGSAWNMVDYIPDLDALLTGRGGWSYASPDLEAAEVGASYVPVVTYGNVPNPELLAITGISGLIRIDSSSSATLMGNVFTPISKPVVHNGFLVIPSNDGVNVIMRYKSSVVASLNGTPPPGKYVCVFKDRTLLANTAAHPTYVYFSQASNPDSTWDTTNSWLSMSEDVMGLAALPNAVLVFQRTRTARLRGSIPPAQGGALGSSDYIVDDPIFNQGCLDARSISTYSGYAIFANGSGVYRTNGSNMPEDLTAAVGLRNYWQALMRPWTTSWTVAGGIYRGEYWCCVMDGTTFKDCLIIDLDKLRARRVANVKTTSFAQVGAVAADEFYFGSRVAARVGSLSSTFTPGASYKNDGDGTAVLPVLETPFYRGRPGNKRWRFAYLDRDLRDAASDNPKYRVSYIAQASDDYTLIGDLGESTNKTRDRIQLGFQSDGFGLKIAQTAAASCSRLYEIGTDAHAVEASRLPQAGEAVGRGGSGIYITR